MLGISDTFSSSKISRAFRPVNSLEMLYRLRGTVLMEKARIISIWNPFFPFYSPYRMKNKLFILSIKYL